jgi:alpha-D-ribose 1-methylphosphonate 5-triphosphate synthase subunit PhnH
MKQSILPGFNDPAGDAQAVFRTTLDAMARPGLIQELQADSGVPAGLSAAMTALLLTLADVDAPVWLPGELGDEAARFLRFHCSSPIAANPGDAVFIAVPAGRAVPKFADCRPGDPAYPDQSATLIIEVESFERGLPLRLTGPGIRDERRLSVQGLPDDFLPQWQANHQRFPLGVDVLLTQGRRVCGLPRTCRLEAC